MLQVRCGATRRKRSVDMTINFDLTLNYGNSSMQSFSQTQENIFLSLKEVRKKRELDIISNVTTIRLQSIVQHEVKLICPSRTVASSHTFSCGKWRLFIQFVYNREPYWLNDLDDCLTHIAVYVKRFCVYMQDKERYLNKWFELLLSLMLCLGTIDRLYII